MNAYVIGGPVSAGIATRPEPAGLAPSFGNHVNDAPACLFGMAVPDCPGINEGDGMAVGQVGDALEERAADEGTFGQTSLGLFEVLPSGPGVGIQPR